MAKNKITLAAWNVLGPRGNASGGIMTAPDPVTERKILTLLEEEDPDFAFLQEVPPLKFMPGLDPGHFSGDFRSRGEDYCRGIMLYRKDPALRVEIVPGSSAFPVAAGYIVRSATTGEELFRLLGIWNASRVTGQPGYFDNFVHILEHFRTFCHAGRNLIIAGDTNLILNADAYRENPAGQSECAAMRKQLGEKLEELGLPPVYPVADNADTLQFVGNGLWYRCDLLMVSEPLRDGLKTGLGRRDLYIGECGSDHLPLFAEFHADASPRLAKER